MHRLPCQSMANEIIVDSAELRGVNFSLHVPFTSSSPAGIALL